MADHTIPSFYERRIMEMRIANRELDVIFREACEWWLKPLEDQRFSEARSLVERLCIGIAVLQTFSDLDYEQLEPDIGPLIQACSDAIHDIWTIIKEEEVRLEKIARWRYEAARARRLRRQCAVREAAAVAFRNICRYLAYRDMLPKEGGMLIARKVMSPKDARRIVSDVNRILRFIDSLTEESQIGLIQSYFGQAPENYANFSRALSDLRMEVEEVLKDETQTTPADGDQSQVGDGPLPREWRSEGE